MGGSVRAASRSASFGHDEKKRLVSFTFGLLSNTLKPELLLSDSGIFCLQLVTDAADDSCFIADPRSGLMDRGVLVSRPVAGAVTVNVAVIDNDRAAGAR